MKINLLILICSLTLHSCSIKAKKSYWLKSNEYFDINGNMYQYKQEYRYPPSKKDSIDFILESKRKIELAIDSFSSSE